ncbi:MAG: MBL fold metallo-hydrolase [Burkholderiales bacterium]
MTSHLQAGQLPPGVRVLERGWLSSNNIVIQGQHDTAVIDTGYASHAAQTVALVQAQLQGRPLNALLNSHLHSDHCGGNAALQAAYPQAQTHIPPGQAAHVLPWNPAALFYEATGQQCPPFRFDALLQPGTSITLGGLAWQIHAAPGHDPHSVIFFEPQSRCLLSADALWENGFGVIFPEIEGERAFDAVADTLDLIASLRPLLVVPGHGPVFSGGMAVDGALARAHTRLAQFASNPLKHARHAAKVLLKFKLLEWQRTPAAHLLAWAQSTPYFELVHRRFFALEPRAQWLSQLIDELAAAGALERQQADLVNI